ncbi:hypothetical protein ACFPM3_26115 [Streptomyces coeruleoprunus]|uniref:Uncharacterized protein n=1 Tax=Streptomyces coeruleoprunus TaxID=285563 RepID=A0ABV9XJM6_9ACTN
MKKYVLIAATAVTASVMAAAPAVAHVAPVERGAAAAAAEPAAPIRIVAPGERVHAAAGVRLWLTEEGKHWSTPDGGENFRSVVDGNLDMSRPGISHQSEGLGEKREFHSGVYYGTKDAARAELTDRDGRTTAVRFVQLPGGPGWGAWYITTPRTEGGHSITLYDSRGRVLAELPRFDF